MDIFYYFLLSINIVICWTLLRIDIKRYSPGAVFWLSTLCFFLLPDIGDPFIGVVEAHPFAVSYYLDMETLIEAQLYIFFILCCFLAAYVFAWSRDKQFMVNGGAIFSQQIASTTTQGLYFLLGFLGLCLYAFLEAYMKLGADIFSSLDFAYRRENLSFLAKFLLSYNFNIVAGLLAAIAICHAASIAANSSS